MKPSYLLAVLLALGGCEMFGPTQPKPLLAYQAALPRCEDVPRVGSTNELSGDMTRDGYHPVGEATIQCYDASTQKAVIMKTVQWEKDAPVSQANPLLREALERVLLRNKRREKLPELAVVLREDRDLRPMTYWGVRARMNVATIEQIAAVFEGMDQDVLQVSADTLVRHYETVTGLDFGHSGRGFAAALRSAGTLVPATVAFLEAHDLSGFRQEGGVAGFYNVSLHNHHPRRTPDQGEQVIMVRGKPVAMTGCLNAVLALGQQVVMKP